MDNQEWTIKNGQYIQTLTPLKHKTQDEDKLNNNTENTDPIRNRGWTQVFADINHHSQLNL
jgi:hypothetical protein